MKCCLTKSKMGCKDYPTWCNGFKLRKSVKKSGVRRARRTQKSELRKAVSE